MDISIYTDFYESNRTKEDRIKWIAKLASISYGNEEAKNPERLVKTLVLRGHQSLFEFIRLPFLCPISKTYKGYSIEDSLRHNPELMTFEELSNLYNEDQLIQWFKETLALLKISTPIFIDRQLVRHRSDSRIEMSRRYVKPDKVEFTYWFPKNVSPIEKDCFTEEMNQRYQRNFARFQRAELARYDQPLNLYTTYYVLRDFKGARNFYVRRFNKHAQKETRELVELELRLLRDLQPEFKGQYVSYQGDPIHILDLKKLGETMGVDVLKVDYGNKYYYAVFDVKAGMFVDDEPKDPDYLLKAMFSL